MFWIWRGYKDIVRDVFMEVNDVNFSFFYYR